MALVPSSSRASRSSQTATSTLTANRAGGFQASHVFDLGQICSFYIATTVTASDADGETWGTSPGEIAIDTEKYQTSDDGVAFKDVSTNSWYADDTEGPSSASFRVAGVTARYLKVLNLRIIDSDFNVYSGSNDPTVTVRFDVTYV